MKNRTNRARTSGRLDEKQKRLLGMLLIPAVVIVLILIIVAVDKAGKKETEEAPVTVEASTGETMAESLDGDGSADTTASVETEPTDSFASENFQRDPLPELVDLMKQYLDARAAADAETINGLYGIADVSVSALEAQKTRMRNNSKYVTGFESVATYVKPGTTGDAWLVYATAEIKFRSVETTAPMLMWTYVTKDGEGNYRFHESSSLSAEILKYVEEANRTEEVRRLAADVNQRLKQALTADVDLNAVYGILNADSPIWIEEGQENTSAEVKILDEETETSEEPSGVEPTVAEPAEASLEATPQVPTESTATESQQAQN